VSASEITAIVTKCFNLSKPGGFFTSHQAEYSKILHGGGFVLSVLCGSHNKHRLLLYTSLSGWFL